MWSFRLPSIYLLVVSPPSGWVAMLFLCAVPLEEWIFFSAWADLFYAGLVFCIFDTGIKQAFFFLTISYLEYEGILRPLHVLYSFQIHLDLKKKCKDANL